MSLSIYLLFMLCTYKSLTKPIYVRVCVCACMFSPFVPFLITAYTLFVLKVQMDLGAFLCFSLLIAQHLDWVAFVFIGKGCFCG